MKARYADTNRYILFILKLHFNIRNRHTLSLPAAQLGYGKRGLVSNSMSQQYLTEDLDSRISSLVGLKEGNRLCPSAHWSCADDSTDSPYEFRRAVATYVE